MVFPPRRRLKRFGNLAFPRVNSKPVHFFKPAVAKPSSAPGAEMDSARRTPAIVNDDSILTQFCGVMDKAVRAAKWVWMLVAPVIDRLGHLVAAMLHARIVPARGKATPE
jgi:hypothetical protein